MSDGNQSVMIDQGTFEGAKKEDTLTVKFPKGKKIDAKAKKITVTVKSMTRVCGICLQEILQVKPLIFM